MDAGSSLFDIIPQISGQYFEARRAEAQAAQPAPPPVIPPDVSRGLQQFLPLLILAGLGLVAYRLLRR
jgi:hypothetical protein